MGSQGIRSMHGSSNGASHKRELNDYYATPEEATLALLKHEKLTNKILEPNVGGGHIARVLEEHGHEVKGIDIIDRGYPNTLVKDFLDYKHDIYSDVVMNPPYKQAKEHVEHALDLMQDGSKLCALLKIQFLESKGRLELFKKYPPKYIYIFSWRIDCAKGGDWSRPLSRAMCYCWYVWVKGYKGSPMVKWLEKGK